LLEQINAPPPPPPPLQTAKQVLHWLMGNRLPLATAKERCVVAI
jgi:hypothetical protein